MKQRPGETDQEFLRRLCGGPGTREEYDEEISEMVADDAPRVFAIVGELADFSDGMILAWGMQFDEAVCVHVSRCSSFQAASLERALDILGRSVRPHIVLRTVWAADALANAAA